MPTLREIADVRRRQGQSDEDYAQSLLNARRNAIPSALRAPEQGLQGGMELGSIGGMPISLTDLIPADFGASTLAALGKAGAAKIGVPMMAGIFAGKGAKTANLSALIKAEGMAKQGIPDAQIWKETGWTLNTPDKMPRFEIPDNAATMPSKLLPSEYIESVGRNEPSWKVGQALDHPDLYANYPSTKDIQSSFMYGQPENANYKSGMDWISYNAESMKKAVPNIKQQAIIDAHNAESKAFYARPDVKAWNDATENFDFNQPNMEEVFNALSQKHGGTAIDNEASNLAQRSLDFRNLAGDGYALRDGKSITLHELQHAIQQREGFASGGSPDSLRQLVKIDNMMQGKPAPTDADVYSAYQRLAGEAEARLTQARMNMTPEQRLAQYPYQPEYFQKATGVPLSDLIVRKQ